MNEQVLSTNYNGDSEHNIRIVNTDYHKQEDTEILQEAEQEIRWYRRPFKELTVVHQSSRQRTRAAKRDAIEEQLARVPRVIRRAFARSQTKDWYKTLKGNQ
mgnify:CR=1 FL=1